MPHYEEAKEAAREELENLRAKATAAEVAYHKHQKPNGLSVSEQVDFDIKERKLMLASQKAANDYKIALNNFMKESENV